MSASPATLRTECGVRQVMRTVGSLPVGRSDRPAATAPAAIPLGPPISMYLFMPHRFPAMRLSLAETGFFEPTQISQSLFKA